MSPVRIGKEGTNRRGFVKNMAAGAGGYTLAAFQTEPERKKKSSDGAGLTKIDELEAKVKMLEGKIRTLEDIEAIKKLQRAYGYYLEHWMAEDIIDCFADGPDTELLVAAGQYRGKENIRDFFHHGAKGVEVRKEKNNEFLHQVMQLSGIVNVAPDGKTAQGQWYGFGANAFPAADNKVTLAELIPRLYSADLNAAMGIYRPERIPNFSTAGLSLAASSGSSSSRANDRTSAFCSFSDIHGKSDTGTGV